MLLHLTNRGPTTPLSFCGSGEWASTSTALRPPSVTVQTQPTTSGERDKPQRSRSPRQTQADTRRGIQQLSMDNEENLISALQEPHLDTETALDELYYLTLSLVPLLSKLDQAASQILFFFFCFLFFFKFLVNLDSSTCTPAVTHTTCLSACPNSAQPHFKML